MNDLPVEIVTKILYLVPMYYNVMNVCVLWKNITMQNNEYKLLKAWNFSSKQFKKKCIENQRKLFWNKTINKLKNFPLIDRLLEDFDNQIIIIKIQEISIVIKINMNIEISGANFRRFGKNFKEILKNEYDKFESNNLLIDLLKFLT